MGFCSPNQRAISFLADSTESLPWQMFLPTSMALCEGKSGGAVRKRLVQSELGFDSLVATNRAWGRSEGVGGTQQNAALLDDVLA